MHANQDTVTVIYDTVVLLLYQHSCTLHLALTSNQHGLHGKAFFSSHWCFHYSLHYSVSIHVLLKQADLQINDDNDDDDNTNWGFTH